MINRNENKSFTLIELLVVIVIIGILAGVIMISTSSSIDKANFAKAQVFSNTVQEELLTNIVSGWSFDEQTQALNSIIPISSTIYDDWVSNNGVSVGSITLKGGNDCIKGKCLDMTLSDTQYVNLPNNKSLYPESHSFTVAGWVYPRDYTYPRSFFPFGNTNASQTGGTGWQIGHGFSNTGLGVRISDGTNIAATTIDCASGYRPIDLLNKWSHVVVVFDRTSLKIFLYVNGQKQTNYASIPSALGNVYNAQDVMFGNMFGWRLDGKLDEVAFYNEALSSSKIKRDYFIGLKNLLKQNFIAEKEYTERIKNLAYEQE